jgi:anti-sigma-K factor RskA
MMGAPHISQDDLALTALQALSLDESAAVREHLSVCELCRDELARLTGDLAMVALSVDQHPLPSGARERFSQRIGFDTTTAKPAEPVPIRSAASFDGARWIAWFAAAAALILAAGLGFEVKSLQARLHDKESRIASLEASQSRAEQVVEVLTAPSAQRILLTAHKTPPAPNGRVVYLASRGELIFQASNLAHVPATKTYELWVIPADGSAPVPAGLFRPDASGNGSVMLPTIPKGVTAKAFGVTLEDAAGSQTPTAPILLAGAVSEGGF